MSSIREKLLSAAPQTRESDLSHTVWIGGSPCAGKSTISRMLAHEYGLIVYETDPLESRPATASQPTKQHLQSLTPDQLWLRPIAEQVATELEYCREELALAIEELRELPGSPKILVEGTALVPQGVVPLLTRPHQAIWLVPTPEFQRQHYPTRGDWPHKVAAATSDPPRAFELWMERDVRYGRIITAMAHQMDQVVIEVDGSRTAEECCAVVAEYLGLEAT